MNVRHRAVVAGLVAALSLGVLAPVAYATPQSELAEAANRLDTLGGELSELQESLAAKSEALEKTSYQIGEKQQQISDTQQELADARQVLGERMRSSYKSGSTSLLAVLLGADSLNDIVSRVYYMDKVASSDAEAIGQVKALEERLAKEKADLEQTKQGQQKAVDELKTQVDDYSVKVSEAQQYYDSLDAQIQAELAAQQEAEENARIQAALEAAEQEKAAQKAAEQKQDEQTTAADTSSKKEDTKKQETKNEETKQATTDDDNSGSSSPGTSKSVPGYGGLSTAYAAIGCPYAWGAAGPSSFDCSGLVCYCYGYGRGRTTYDMIASLKSTGSWKTSMSQLSVGDLVFTNEGHVGIYVGGGQMIHAPSPGRSVCQADVYSFIGGGTF